MTAQSEEKFGSSSYPEADVQQAEYLELKRHLRWLIREGDIQGVVDEIAAHIGPLAPAVNADDDTSDVESREIGILISAADVADYELDALDVGEVLLLAAVARGGESARVNLGFVYFRLGRKEEAEREYRAAMQQGRIAGVRNLLALLRDEDRLQDLSTEARQAVDAGHVEFRIELGDVLHELGDVESAEAEFRKALAEGDPRASSFLGHLLWKVDRVDEAERVFAETLESGDTGVCFDYALMLSELPGREEESLPLYRQAEDVEAHLNLAVTLRDLGRPDEARDEFEKAISLNDLKAYEVYANFLEDEGNRRAADAMRSRKRDAAKGH